MQHYKRLAAVAAAAAMGLAVAGAAQAQSTFGGYAGGSIGQADSGESDLDSSTAYRLFGGYMFTPNWGVEAGYLDAGEFESDGAVSVEGDGMYLVGVGAYPATDRIRIFGKLGVFHYEYDVLNNGNSIENDDGTEMLIGVGVDFALTPTIALGAEYNQVDVDDFDVDAFWLNLQVDFDGQ